MAVDRQAGRSLQGGSASRHAEVDAAMEPAARCSGGPTLAGAALRLERYAGLLYTDRGHVNLLAVAASAAPNRPTQTSHASLTLRTDSRTTMRSPEVAPWASKRTFDSVSSTSSMPWTVA